MKTTPALRFQLSSRRSVSRQLPFNLACCLWAIVACCLFASGQLAAGAPAAGELDATFDAGSSIAPQNAVRALARQPDGKLLIGGSFVVVRGAARNRIARLNSDGSTDLTFLNGLAGCDQVVQCFGLQPDGKILIGGSFLTVNGVARSRIARLNADGTLDTAFQDGMAGVTGAMPPPNVRDIALQPDGKILIGGDFTAVNGVTRSRVARLNSDGSLDTTFVDPAVSGTGGVLSLALQPDGKIIIGGVFTSVGGASRTRIARLLADGTLDTGFQNGESGANGPVETIALQSDGKIFISGGFIAINGTTYNKVARLLTDGSIDTTFQNPAHLSGPASVFALAIQPDGKLVIGGTFTYSTGTQSRGHLGRLNADGTRDASFDQTSGANNTIEALQLQPDGQVLIGGNFTTFDGVPRVHVGRVNGNNGALDPTFENGPQGPDQRVEALALQADGKLLIGGGFGFVNATARNGVARLNTDGSLDLGFQDGMAGVNGSVSNIAVRSDGKILIGGQFTNANGSARQNLAQLNPDGSLDLGFLDPAVAGGPVNSIAIQPDGQVLIGGAFNSVGGNASFRRIARLNPDGTPDLAFHATVDTPVISVALQPDGKVLIGGRFQNVGGTSRNRIARLNSDGTLDTTFLNGLSGANNLVLWVASQPDGKVLIGGDFTSVNDTPRNRVARLNSDGSLDTTFLDGLTGVNSTINSIASQPDGKVLIAGVFVTVNGVGRTYLARLNNDGSLDPAFNANMSVILGPSIGVYSMVMASDGKILIGGSFAIINGVGRDRVARLHNDISGLPTISCPANLIVNTDPGQCSAVVDFSVSALDDSGTVTVNCTPPPGSTFQLGTTSVHCTATDPSGNVAQCSFTVTVLDANPPEVTLNGGLLLSAECHGNFIDPGASALDLCDGTLSVNVEGNVDINTVGTYTLTYSATDQTLNTGLATRTVTVIDSTAPVVTLNGEAMVTIECHGSFIELGATASDLCAGTLPVSTSGSVNTEAVGVYTLFYRATDPSGRTGLATRTVTVVDTTAPTIVCPAPVTINAEPNSQAAIPDLRATASVSDICSSADNITVDQQPAPGTMAGSGSHTILLTATDAAGNQGSCTTTVTINGASATPPVVTILRPFSGQLALINTPILFTGTFSDDGAAGTHTAQWIIKNGSLPELTITGTVSDLSVSNQITFSAAGVYSIRLVVTDAEDMIGEATTVSNDLPAYLVIYDPNGGFVTGGGWIWSPPGAFHPQLEPAELEGRATFGFVSKYQKGALVPTGNTEFQFQAGDLNFHSHAYQWLVISGPRAQYKGSGTINNAGNFGFLLTAVDGQAKAGGGSDRFRLKLWDNDTDLVIYDNQPNTPESAELGDATLVRGGSIVIHK